MNLSLEEKEKLLIKASHWYNMIKDIKIRDTINIFVESKYYPNGYKGYNKGFTKYHNGCSIDSESIGNCIENLKNYINFKKYNGEEYINGKSVSFMSNFEINSLLDFVYHGNYIYTKINEINETRNKELNSLLD